VSISYDFELAARLVVMRCQRAPVGEWVVAMHEVLADARFEPGLAFLLDECGLVVAPTVEELREAATFVRSNYDAFASSRWAIVAHSPVALALARAAAVFFEEFGIEAGAFQEADAARAWLARDRSSV
jgi:predicted ATPase